jgi:glycosyltransferase involved in cell wall biosynthesis
MKIAVDARELAGRPTGVGRYLSELLNEWSDTDEASKHEWRLYAHKPAHVPNRFRSAVQTLRGVGGTIWEQLTLSRALATYPPDVLFAPGYSAPLTARCPIVLTVHDVSFAAHPEWYTFREGARRRVLTSMAARRARVVITDSAFSRSEITRHLGVPPPHTRVIPLGVRPPATIGDRPAREPMILFVGSIFARRHVDALLNAFATDVAERVSGSRLEIVGENRSYPRIDLDQLVAAQPDAIRARIALRSYVDDAALLNLYARAAVFAFPSEYEGFGLTPLEALAAGVPPVILDTPVAHEVYGLGARYVPAEPPIERALAAALVEMLTSDDARREILRHAPTVVAQYRWSRAAEETLAVLREAAGA